MGTFWLGTSRPHWLTDAGVPLMLSRRPLARLKSDPPRAAAPWALDSGAFTELTQAGRHRTTAREYAEEVRRWGKAAGELAWASVQDWMCEPEALARTGLDVAEHQRRTADNYAELLELAPDLPWLPVLQGWTLDDYRRHVDAYDRRGLPLRDRLVGLGSVCKRQATGEGVEIVRGLWLHTGLRLHAFGFKSAGLVKAAAFLESADSMAWSNRSRWEHYHDDGDGRPHASRHCMRFAMAWRRRLLTRVGGQLALPMVAA